MACSWAEEVMSELGGGSGLGKKNASFRKGVPTAAQLYRASREGINVPLDEDGKPTLSKGEVSDLLSQRVGTRRIDPVINAMLTMRGM
jgi:hypothetical protein